MNKFVIYPDNDDPENHKPLDIIIAETKEIAVTTYQKNNPKERQVVRASPIISIRFEGGKQCL